MHRIYLWFANTGHYDSWYLVLIACQTGFLIWYAFETHKIRRAAIDQAKIIEGQTETIGKQYALMAEQTRLLAQQVGLNAQTYELAKKQHELEVKKAELEEASRKQAILPAFTHKIQSNANGEMVIQFHNINENVAFTDFRSNNGRVSIPETMPPNPHKFVVVMPNNVAVLYFGVQFRAQDGQVRDQVFAINPAAESVQPTHEVPFNQLIKLR